MATTEFIEQLRTELPKVLREHPEVRHEVWGIMLEAFPSRQEFLSLLEEVRTGREESSRHFEELRQDTNRRFEELRQDMNRRFEVVDRRFEAVDRRFAEVITTLQTQGEILRQHTEDIHSIKADLRATLLGMSSLGERVGYGLEGVIRGTVEEFAKEEFPFAERLVLQDDTGEVYGIVGAPVEFDAYVHNGKAAYLVEAKSYLKPADVWMFQRKVKFAESKLARPITPLVLALSFAPGALRALRSLGMPYRVGVVTSEELLSETRRE
ncbi:MAG: DUF3782 domain-containing protein [Candidatus Binatia bacterium]